MVKAILKKMADAAGYMILKKGYPRDIERETEFISLLKKCEPFTMVDTERSFALYEAMRYVLRTSLAGDIVECGVWKGGQAMLMAYLLLGRRDTNRRIWLYDTFTGMSAPTAEDVYAYPEDPAPVKWRTLDKGDYVDWCYASEAEVRRNVASTGYPADRFVFVKGKVEDTIPGTMPDSIALLRLDTDFYESTKHELEYLYPRLMPGGVLVIDDYGSWEGARKAVDEYIVVHGAKILLLRAGPGRIGVKLG